MSAIQHGTGWGSSMPGQADGRRQEPGAAEADGAGSDGAGSSSAVGEDDPRGA